MPRRRTDDVVHAVITDHFIQRALPAQNLLAEIPERHPQYQGEIVPYYPSPLPDKDENAMYQAAAQVMLQNNLQSGLSDLAHEMAKNPPREMEFYVVLGDAWRNSDRPDEAAAAFREAVRRKPTSLTALQSLAGALQVERKTSLSEETLKRALQIAPSNGNVWFQYGMLESQLGRTDRAIENLQKAVALNPDLPEGDLSLASLLARKGQIDSAESALRSALSIDPYDAAAYDLRGQVLADKEELPEALYNFEKANRLRPKYAPYLFDYALGLVRANRAEEALAQAQAATSADPGFAEAHELSGGLLAGAGNLAEAAAQYRQALESKPGISRVDLKLGLVLVAEGDLAGATEHLKKAAQASDPQVARQATLALQRIGKY
jgi:tetratricopeptide (TPR) repeat protein